MAVCNEVPENTVEGKEELLDSGSTVSLMRDAEKCEDIMDRDVKVIMSTNAGKKAITQEATRKGYGKVLFDKEAMTNLRSLSEMVKRGHHVFLDTDVENAFVVTSPSGDVSKYSCNKRGLYALVKEVMCHQVKGFTPREVERAKERRSCIMIWMHRRGVT